MINTLYLPELREMLAQNDAKEMAEFCQALHPARTAEFMEGLTAEESWEVLRHAEPESRAEIFSYLERDKQVECVEKISPEEAAELFGRLANDDSVDLLAHVRTAAADAVLARLGAEQRRAILRLRTYPEHTAGAMMTTEFARVGEGSKVRESLEEVGRQAERLETIYYLYVVDDEDHLRGIVSARQLLSAMGKPDVRVRDVMERDVISVGVEETEEAAAQKVADFDLLAIPVVDHEHRILGIITHDDAIDVVRQQHVEDAHLQAGVEPLQESYLQTRIYRLAWKRGIWLTVLFFSSMMTAVLLNGYQSAMNPFPWLVMFIPLIVSSGGNSGNQSATLIITALSTKDLDVGHWRRVVVRELLSGLLLGTFLGLNGFVLALLLAPTVMGAAVVGATLLMVIVCGTLAGSMLPLLFRRLGLDPALMSNPLVACLIDIAGIVIYVEVALRVLSTPK